MQNAFQNVEKWIEALRKNDSSAQKELYHQRCRFVNIIILSKSKQKFHHIIIHYKVISDVENNFFIDLETL